jgi:hypothetical protein
MALDRWTKGYTQAELDDAQAKFGLVFPPKADAIARHRTGRAQGLASLQPYSRSQCC